MLYNYLIIAFRRLVNNWITSSVSILGLTVGFASFLIAALHVLDELSYDQFWENSDNTYRIETQLSRNGGTEYEVFHRSHPMIAKIVESNANDVQSISRIRNMGFLVAHEENRNYTRVGFVDESFFNLFDYQFIEGNKESALSRPYSIVISRDNAFRLFGDESALNQYVTLDGDNKFLVTGVIDDLPKQSHLNLGLFASISSIDTMYEHQMLTQWRFPNVYTYVHLNGDVDPDQWLEEVNKLLPSHTPDEIRGALSLSLIELDRIHVRSNVVGGFNVLNVLIGIATLVLVMGAINTINLATAQSSDRSKETGIRKALGGMREQLFAQFMVESYIQVLIALVISLLVIDLGLPWFNILVDKELAVLDLFKAEHLMVLISLFIVTGFLAGAYPATVLSGFKPTDIFKGNDGYGTGSYLFRSLLVMLQFGIAISLTIASYYVFVQMQHVKDADMGFNDDNVVVINNIGWNDIWPRYDTLHKEIAAIPGVEKLAGAQTVPGKVLNVLGDFKPQNSDLYEGVTLNRVEVDFGFFDALDIELLAGRSFSREYGFDVAGSDQEVEGKATYSAVLSKQAVKKLGFASPQDAVNNKLISSDQKWPFDINIVGVVDDIHLDGGKGAIKPYVFIVNPGAVNHLIVKIAPSEMASANEQIIDTWNRLIPAYPIVKDYLDEELEKSFGDWQKSGEVIAILTVLAVLIAAAGSFGLAAFSAKTRNKEIGLRKLMGASSFDLLKLMLTDFSKPLLLANFVAIPVCYWYLQDWLNSFSYRIDLSIGVFLLVVISSLLLCWATVSFHTLKIIATNPSSIFRHN